MKLLFDQNLSFKLWLCCGNQPTHAIEKLLRDHAQVIANFE